MDADPDGSADTAPLHRMALPIALSNVMRHFVWRMITVAHKVIRGVVVGIITLAFRVER